jgi:sarcosine oxidase
MADRHEFVVVGAGLVGLAATRELARRGGDVVCVEQATIGHDRSGSKGTSRIFRFGYDDPLYVEMAMRSLAGWHSLGDEASEPLLETFGLLSFGERVDELAAAMDGAGARAAILGEEALAERFPEFAIGGRAVFEASAGVLRADRILAVLADSARADGAEIRQRTRAESLTELDDRVRIDLAGSVLECEVALLCAGAFSGELASLTGLPQATVFRPSLQQVAYFGPPARGLACLPAFVERGPVTYYGVPTPASGQYKVGVHDPGATVRPGSVVLDVDAAALALLVSAVERLIPALDPRPLATERCFYDNTPDEDFVIERLGRLVVGAGTSGHGFKFGPLWGEILADLAQGVTPAIPMERFSMRRPRPEHGRSPVGEPTGA